MEASVPSIRRQAARLRAGLAAVLLGALLSSASARDEDAAELRRACDEAAEAYGLSGVVLVARGDDVLVERAYGMADVEAGRPNTTDTRFLVASLTKPVVGFLTLRLVERGALGLDDVASEHVPALAGTPAGAATVHRLLTHTSGLPHYEGWPGFLAEAGEPHDESELSARLARTELVAEPGASFRYSGPGYLLLGLVLERAGDAPLPELARELVFEPLGMDATRVLGADEEATDHARPYVRADASAENALVPATYRHPSTLRATGGLVSTARDLHRFARAVQQGTLLRPESHATLLRAVHGRYACGLIVYTHPWTGTRFARHLGSMSGVAAHFVFGLDGDERVCIALSNVSPTAVDDLDDRLMARLPLRRERSTPDAPR